MKFTPKRGFVGALIVGSAKMCYFGLLKLGIASWFWYNSVTK